MSSKTQQQHLAGATAVVVLSCNMVAMVVKLNRRRVGVTISFS